MAGKIVKATFVIEKKNDSMIHVHSVHFVLFIYLIK